MIVEVDNNLPRDHLRIEYMLGNLCNYKCHYCFPGSNEGDQHWPDISVVKKNIKHLLEFYKNNGKNTFHFYLVGGETTLWKDLPEFCEYIKQDFNCVIEVSTNATRKFDWWKEHAKSFDHIDISVHHQYANINHIKEIADLLYEQNICVCVDVLIDPYDFDKCADLVEQLKNSRYHWPIVAKTVHFNGSHRYTDQQLEYFKEQVKQYPDMDWYHSTNKLPKSTVTVSQTDGSIVTTTDDNWLIKNDLNHFKNWTCNIGLDIIKIFPDGRITGNCQQTLFGESKTYSLYSETFTEDFNPMFVPATCTKDTCPCPRETVAKKMLYHENF
jgi:MoaA/NifB/PqqE/SkfB family radical SAM enzyme